MSYVYMKVLESAPERYDRGMCLLTAGRLERVHHDIAVKVAPGSRVLDLGCGTGALAARLTRQGCRVVAIDILPSMLAQAARRLREEGMEHGVTLRDLSVTELEDAFADGSFDAVSSTLVFSELSKDEIAYALAECWRILGSGGQLFIADEVMPESLMGRVATFVFRLPFQVVAFILTQNTTRRVSGLGERIQEAGFQLLDVKRYLAGTLRLFCAVRTG